MTGKSANDMPPPGEWVRVTKRVRFQDRVRPVVCEGRVVEYRRFRTESALAGSPDGRHWIDEVLIEKAGGEHSVMVFDEWTRIEPVDRPATARKGPEDAKPEE